jgi:hypothetical protein
MPLSTRHFVLGSALLLAGASVYGAETSSASGVAAAPRAYVNCPGVSSVPLTADAEQSLPLAQIAALACGEAVSVLSDNTGYTLRVRTSEGKQGYVAYMYLTREAGLFRPKADAPVEPVNGVAQNGVMRWNGGAPGCELFTSDGHVVESATVSGVTVQVSLEDTGWKLRATIVVSNQSGEKVYVLPKLITLDELLPGLRSLRQENPAKLMHNEANHQLMRAEYSAQPSASAVAYRSGPAARLSASAYRTSPVQGYLANRTEAPPVKDLALKTVSLAPGQETTGELWFARDPNAHELSMRLAIGDVVYDFPFSFKQKK